MSFVDKIKNKIEDLTGKGKEATGKATGNAKLESEGKGDQTSASFKDAGENVKDSAENVKDAVKDAKDGLTK